MKKLLLLLLLPFISCDMSSTGVVAVVMSDDDVEYYSETEAEDELTETILELAQDYTKADFEDAKEYYADDAKVFFNSTEVTGKDKIFEGWTYEHEVFSDITITDEYAHTNYFTDGRIWTNYWFTWSATGNFTGERLVIKGHFDYEWKDGKIVQALGFFADEQFNKEYAAAMAAAE
jgi:hypothetical protein